MKTGPFEAFQKILALNIALAVAVYFIQPDIVANYENSLDKNYQVKQDLKLMTQDVRDYIFRSETKSYPEDPRVINFNNETAGIETVPDNWTEFNDLANFSFSRTAGEIFKDSKMKIILIERKELAVNLDGRWASFEDGSIRLIRESSEKEFLNHR